MARENRWKRLILVAGLLILAHGPVWGSSAGPDGDGDLEVDDFELLEYIDSWAQGAVMDFDLLRAIDWWATGQPPGLDEDAYAITEGTNEMGETEYRFGRGAHHFMTLLTNTGGSKSTLVLRPHPGVDPNGWGSSWYAQPFLPGAVLDHTAPIECEAGEEGIAIRASGKVSKGADATFGIWTLSLELQYHGTAKRIVGTGRYSIAVTDPLPDDLNLYRIASNYLDEVPLVTGEVGDTGDMSRAEVVGDGFAFTWIPPEQPAHFPGDTTRSLSIDVKGQYNLVDTAAQGYDPIAPAYKPSLRVDLASDRAGIPMIFGAIYDTDKATLFFEDNVGITPLVLKSWMGRELDFTVQFESLAPPGDGRR